MRRQLQLHRGDPVSNSEWHRDQEAGEIAQQEWQKAAQDLAASNERLCRLLIAADALALQLQRYITACTTPSRVRSPDYSLPKVAELLEAYQIARSGS